MASGAKSKRGKFKPPLFYGYIDTHITILFSPRAAGPHAVGRRIVSGFGYAPAASGKHPRALTGHTTPLGALRGCVAGRARPKRSTNPAADGKGWARRNEKRGCGERAAGDRIGSRKSQASHKGQSVSAYGRARAAGVLKKRWRLRAGMGAGAQAGMEERAAARKRVAPQRL